jgi:hypothetical protein
MAWKLAQCRWRDKLRLNDYLAESWEPFAATETDHEATIWLRRSASPHDAGVVEMPLRPRHEPDVA